MLQFRSFLFLIVLVSMSGTALIAEETKTLVWPDGTRYVGGVKDGKRSGKGTIFWQDGTRFVGTFVDDLRNGPGTMILPDGTVYNGYFENDQLVQQAQANVPDGRSEPTAPIAEISADDVSPEPIVEAAESAEPPEPEEVVAQVEETAPALEPEQVAEEPALPMLTVEMRQEIQTAIDQWAGAWSNQDVAGYLGAYAESFEVPGRQSRRQWEGLRRSRLTRPSRIEVTISYDTFEVVDIDKVQVDFNQVYDSNLFSDRTNKRLVMIQQVSGWKILSETSI